MKNQNNNTPRPKIDKDILKRLLKYITSNYKLKFTIVFICIILSTVSTVAGSLYLEVLIDDYITPLIGVQNPVLTSFMQAIGVMAIIYAVGIITSLIYSRIMVDISEGILKTIRDDMFVKMQRLPIKY